MTKILRGQIKAGKSAIIGNAGEYFVVGELLRRGLIAALAPRNAPDFDVVATEGTRALGVRVKTKTAAAKFWRWNVKKDGSIFGEIRGDDVTILVDLNDGDSPVDYFVLPTSTLDGKLRELFERWVRQPGRTGQPHDPTNKIRGIGDNPGDMEWLQGYRARWSIVLGYLTDRVEVKER